MRKKSAYRTSGEGVSTTKQIEGYLVGLMYKEAPQGLLSSLLLLILAAVLFAQEYSLSETLIWSGSLSLILLSRIVLVLAFRRDRLRNRSYKIWRDRFTLSALITGIGWGAGFWYFLSFEQNQLINAFIVFLAAGLTAGAIHTLGGVLLAYWLYLAPILLSLALKFFTSGEPIAMIMGIIILIYAGFIALTASRFNHAIRVSYRLNLENTALINTLTQAKNQSDVINEELKEEVEKAKKRDEQLREARDLAEQANRAKSDFLAIMSHELRTPLNGILGMFQVLKDTALDDEQLSCLDTAHTSAESLLYHIESMLEFSKLETGKVSMRRDRFSLKTIVDEILEHFVKVAQEQQNNLTVSIDSGIPKWLIGDPFRIKHIITQFLSNAIKFTEKGEIKLELICLEIEDNTAIIRMTLRDSGIGMDQNTQKMLFQPFTQADSSYTRNYEGIGLGMAIAYRLINLMNGTISLVSAPGEGTSFVINLPIEIAEEQEHVL